MMVEGREMGGGRSEWEGERNDGGGSNGGGREGERNDGGGEGGGEWRKEREE